MSILFDDIKAVVRADSTYASPMVSVIDKAKLTRLLSHEHQWKEHLVPSMGCAWFLPGHKSCYPDCDVTVLCVFSI